MTFARDPSIRLNLLFDRPGDNTPLRFKIAGGLSLFSWFAVLHFGRMLPLVGNAF